MKTLAALGIAGGFFMPTKWVLLYIVIKIASRVSTGLAVVILREVLRSGTIR